MAESALTAFVDAFGSKDRARLKSLLHPDVDFKALTPGRLWEAESADELVDDVMLGAWFEPSDVIDEVVSVETEPIGLRHRVGYRFRVTNGDGTHIVEQQAYVELDGEQIAWMRVVCAGYQPISAVPAR